MKKNIVFVLMFIITALFCVNVSAKEYEISNFDVVMSLSEEGDFLVEERITFHFLSGDFSYAYREIEGNVFTGLEYIGLEGINATITDYELDEGKDLNIKWYYDCIGDTAAFVFKYRGVAGLQSIGGKNVIEWTPTGAEWDVPIRDIDIYIKFPREPEELELRPSGDVVFQDSKEVHFHKDLLTPGREYVVYLSFPEMISMAGKKEPSPDSAWTKEDKLFFLSILFAGLLFSVIDLSRINRLRPEKGNYSVDELLLYEKAALYSNITDTRKGVNAQIFSLAQRGKIKLVSSIKKGVFAARKAEISVEILNTDGLDDIEKSIINNLKKHKTLKKFFEDYRWFSRVDKDIKNELRKKGFISPEREEMRKNIYISSLLLLFPSLGLFIIGGALSKPPLTGAATALLIIAFGRLIKGLLTDIMTAEALYLKKEAEKEIEEKKRTLDRLVKNRDGTAALSYFFSWIGYIILHRYFGSAVLGTYKKAFKRAEKAELPEWLGMDTSELGITLDALELIDLIDYMMVSMVYASYSGTATGAGAGGGTAGGGGGGAG